MLGICLAAPILIPALRSYMNSERNSANIWNIVFEINNYIPRINIKIRDIIFNSFYDRASYLSGITAIEFISIIILFCIFKNKKSLQLKIAVVGLIIALHLPITDYLFNAFVESNSRWVFFLHFIVAIIFVYVNSEIKKLEIVVEHESFWILSLRKDIICLLIYILIPLNIIGNIWMLYSAIGNNWKEEFVRMDDCSIYIDSPYNYSEVLSQDSDIFRVSNDSLTNINGRPENVAMLNGYNGLTYWFSIINEDTQKCVNEFGGENLAWRSYGFNHNSIFESFAGVKYYLRNSNESIPEEYELIEQVKFNNESWDIYRNPNYFGMAYVRDKQKSDDLWNKKENYEMYFENIYDQIKDSDQVDLEYDDNSETFYCRVYAEKNSELVMFIPYSKNWKVFVNGEKKEIGRTDIMYIAVPLEKEGIYEVSLTYSPIGFQIGLCFMIAAVLVICIIMIKNFTKTPCLKYGKSC